MPVKTCQMREQVLSVVFTANDCRVGIAPIEHLVLSVSYASAAQSGGKNVIVRGLPTRAPTGNEVDLIGTSNRRRYRRPEDDSLRARRKRSFNRIVDDFRATHRARGRSSLSWTGQRRATADCLQTSGSSHSGRG